MAEYLVSVEESLSLEDRELLGRIERFQLDEPGARLTFSDRLARENGWSASYATRIVDEYRRFVFLAAAAGHPVTPSDDVDQAWHLHLVYTRSYWDELCGEVLDRPLHHGPTKGGSTEGAKYHDWYERTLASYQRLFGHEPPADIWPSPERRFANAHRFTRVNTAEHWIIAKPTWLRGWGSDGGGRRSGGRSALLAAGLALFLVTGCVAATGTATVLAEAESADSDLSWLSLLIGFGVFAVAIGVLAVRGVWLERRGQAFGSRRDRWAAGGDTGCDGGCGTGCGGCGGGCGGCGGCGG